MTARYSGQQPAEVRRFSINEEGEITIQISEHDGQHYMIIKQQVPAENASSTHTVEIPVSKLSELKRAVVSIEETYDDEVRHGQSAAPSTGVAFAHDSEEEFARILNFYHIAWQYEPRTFAIEWDESGNVTKSFTPDFYLPEHDLFIEITTLKQSLVTKKNRKLRLLKEAYPEVNIKLLYASDYRKLIEKFVVSGYAKPDSESSESEDR